MIREGRRLHGVGESPTFQRKCQARPHSEFPFGGLESVLGTQATLPCR